MPGRHAHRGRPPIRRAETGCAEIAVGLQKTRRNWLIIWSSWRQKYTGFACFTREPTIVDEAKIDRFVARLKQVEYDESLGRA